MASGNSAVQVSVLIFLVFHLLVTLWLQGISRIEFFVFFSRHDSESGSGTKPTAFDPEKLFTVYAPKGKLGIVLENPDFEGPIVYIIRDNSPLKDKMAVGDRLVAVDEVDVRTMSPVQISKLIAKRSANPMRKLTMLKASASSEQDKEEGKGENSGKQKPQRKTNDGEEEKEADEGDSSKVDVGVGQVKSVRLSEITAAREVCVDQSFESGKSSDEAFPGLGAPEATPEVASAIL